MELLDFINANPNWEAVLSKAPYNLSIKSAGNLRLLKYNHFTSDFSNKIVCQARGIIVSNDTGNWRPVCYAFDRFFNYDEPVSAKNLIDWTSAKVLTKVDGSIIKLFFYNNAWQVATNSMINAFEVVANSPKAGLCCETKTFGDLFMEAAKVQNLNFESLAKNKTYIFELTSIYNEQVVHYEGVQIWHLGTRNLDTLQEEAVDIGIQKPKQWPITCLQDCIDIAANFKDEQEGFVVVDKYWHRIKVKSPYYFMKSHDLNDALSAKALVDIYLTGEYGEFLAYFPKYTEVIERLKIKLADTAIELSKAWQKCIASYKFKGASLSRKDFYFLVKDLDKLTRGYCLKQFTTYNSGKDLSATDYLQSWLGLRQFLIDFLHEKIV